MKKISEELKAKSCFQISGMLGLDGTLKKKRFPGHKRKLLITEHHFLWVLNEPNPSHFIILFHFYPIQVINAIVL